MYQVKVIGKALKFLRDLPKNYKETIKDKLKILQTNIMPRNSIRLKGRENCFRLRIGPYRIQYHVIAEEKTVLIYKISKRDETTYKF